MLIKYRHLIYTTLKQMDYLKIVTKIIFIKFPILEIIINIFHNISFMLYLWS